MLAHWTPQDQIYPLPRGVAGCAGESRLIRISSSYQIGTGGKVAGKLVGLGFHYQPFHQGSNKLPSGDIWADKVGMVGKSSVKTGGQVVASSHKILNKGLVNP